MEARVVVREVATEVWVPREADATAVERVLRELPMGCTVVVYRSGHMPIEEVTEALIEAQPADLR